MERYIWGEDSPVYHDRNALTERCQTDQLNPRREGAQPPAGKTLCQHCAAQAAWEAERTGKPAS